MLLWGSVFSYNLLSLQDLFEMMLDIQRMEKLEFGGLKGKLYSEQAAQMYSEFSNHCQALQHSENNPLDLNSEVCDCVDCVLYKPLTFAEKKNLN